MSPTSHYPHVFQPLTIGATTVRHRIMVTGYTQLYGQDGLLSERHIDYYAERARGGAALLVLEQQAHIPPDATTTPAVVLGILQSYRGKNTSARPYTNTIDT